MSQPYIIVLLQNTPLCTPATSEVYLKQSPTSNPDSSTVSTLQPSAVYYYHPNLTKVHHKLPMAQARVPETNAVCNYFTTAIIHY